MKAPRDQDFPVAQTRGKTLSSTARSDLLAARFARDRRSSSWIVIAVATALLCLAAAFDLVRADTHGGEAAGIESFEAFDQGAHRLEKWLTFGPVDMQLTSQVSYDRHRDQVSIRLRGFEMDTAEDPRIRARCQEMIDNLRAALDVDPRTGKYFEGRDQSYLGRFFTTESSPNGFKTNGDASHGFGAKELDALDGMTEISVTLSSKKPMYVVACRAPLVGGEVRFPR